MDLKGFTTVDEVGGEDSQVREKSTSTESFKPATAAEEIDYINKILADIEGKTGDSDVNGVQEDILCSVPELDSESAEQQPTDDVLTQARELRDVTKGKEIESVDGLSAEPIVSSPELCKGELDSTPNQTFEGTDHDEGTCQTQTHGTSELSPVIEDTTSLAINTDNGNKDKLESRHHLVEDLSNNCVSGEKELKENEQEVHNSIVLGNISDLLADSRESAVDPSLLEPDKEGRERQQLNEEQIGVLIKKEPVDAPEEEFDFGNALFDPAEEFNVKREVKEEPCESLVEEIPLDVSCQENQENPFDGLESVKLEPDSEDPCLVIPSVHFLVEDKIYNREQVTAAFLMSQSSLASVVDMNMFADVGRSVLIVRTRQLEELIKNPSLIPLDDAEILKKFISDNDKNIYYDKNDICLKVPKAGPAVSKKRIKKEPKKRQKKKTGKNGVKSNASQKKKPSLGKEEESSVHFIGFQASSPCKLEKSEDSFEQVNASVKSESLLSPKRESGNDSESEYIHLGNVTPKKNKDKRKQKSPSKLGVNKDVFTFRKKENVLRSDNVVSSSIQCKSCYVVLVDISKNKEYQTVVSKLMHTIKTEQAAVELPVNKETPVVKLEGIKEIDVQIKNENQEENNETDCIKYQNDIDKEENTTDCETRIDRSDSADGAERLSLDDESLVLQLSENEVDRAKGEAENRTNSEKEALILEEEPLRDENADKEWKEEKGEGTNDSERTQVDVTETGLGEEEGSKHCKHKFESGDEIENVQSDRDTETPSRCKEGLVLGDSDLRNKRRSKGSTGSDLEDEKSKKKKRKSRREQKLESTEEKAKRLSLKLNKIFKREREKHKREASSPDLQVPQGKRLGSAESRGKNYTSRSSIDDQGKAPTVDSEVLKNVFSRPVLNTFRIPKKKKVTDDSVVEQKSVLASREHQIASKKPSGYAPRTLDQKRETNRHKKDRDLNVGSQNRSQRGNEGRRSSEYSQNDWGGGSCSPPDQGHDVDSACEHSPAPYSPGEGQISGNQVGEAEKNAHGFTLQQITIPNNSEVQGPPPPPPPVIECWEELAELIRTLENCKKGSTDSPANLELGSNVVDLEKDIDVVVDSSDSGSTTKKLASEAPREGTLTAEQSNIDRKQMTSLKGEIELGSRPQPGKLVAGEYTAEGKGVENQYSHLDKRQKTKLYEKKKKSYYEAKKKYYNEKGDVENNEKKQMRFKEYEKRREDYYNMKWYLYEEKRREHIERKKASKEKEESKIAKEQSKTVLDETDSGVKEAENVIDMTENNLDEPENVRKKKDDITNETEKGEPHVNKVYEVQSLGNSEGKLDEVQSLGNSEGKVDESATDKTQKDGDSEMPPLLPPPLPPTNLMALAPKSTQQGHESLESRLENIPKIGSTNVLAVEREENSDMDLDSDMDLATSESSDEDNDELNLLARFGVDVSNLHGDSSTEHEASITQNQEVIVCDSSSSLRNIVHKLMDCVSSDTGNSNTKNVCPNPSTIIDLASSPEVVKTVGSEGTEGETSQKGGEDNELLGLSSLLKKVAKRIHPTPPPKSASSERIKETLPSVPDKPKDGTSDQHIKEIFSGPEKPKESSSDQYIKDIISAVPEKDKEKVSKWTARQFLPLEELTDPKGSLDESNDLEVVYSRISLPDPRRGSRGDALPSYYQQTPLGQVVVDKSKDMPLLGLQYVLEVRKAVDTTLDKCFFICALCSKKMSSETLVAHINSVPHKLKFSESHCKDVYDIFGKVQLKEWTAALVKEFSLALKKVEEKHGRKKMAVTTEREMSSVLMALKKKIVEVAASSQANQEKPVETVEEEPKTQSLPSAPQEIPLPPSGTAVNLSTIPVPTKQDQNKSSSGSSAGAKGIGPKKIEINLSKVKLASTTGSATNKNESDASKADKPDKPENQGEEEEDVIVLADEASNEGKPVNDISNGRKFAKRHYNPGLNIRSRSPPRPVSPKRKRSRSPVQRRVQGGRYSPRRSGSPKYRFSPGLRNSPRISPRRSPRRTPRRSPRRSRTRSRSPSFRHRSGSQDRSRRIREDNRRARSWSSNSSSSGSSRSRSRGLNSRRRVDSRPDSRHWHHGHKRSRSQERSRRSRENNGRARSWSSNSSSSGSSRSRSRGLNSRHRLDSRSDSRHWHHEHKSKDRRSPSARPRNMSDERSSQKRKLADFREAEAKLIAMHKEYQRIYDLRPETHPYYNREWQRFWDKRSLELRASGVDPKTYNFKEEWVGFWLKRMKELDTVNFKTNREALLWKFKIKDPGPIEAGITEGWEVSKAPVERSMERSPSPWEDERLVKNPSPTPQGSNPSNPNPNPEPAFLVDNQEKAPTGEKKFEEEFSVIGTLRMLNELEEQLGSFGPAIATLLEKAIDSSQQGGNPIELFKDPDNFVLVRYAREKLVSQISAGILSTTAYMRSLVAVERAMWLQSQAEKLNEQENYLGLDIPTIARATQGMDKVQIAQYIAQYLLQVGKSDATEEELQNILIAVSTNHAKLLSDQNQIIGNQINSVKSPVEMQRPLSANEGSSSHSAPRPPALFPSGVSQPERQEPSNNSNKKNEENGGLAILQSAYEDEDKPKDMDKLSLEDLQALLANFRSLSGDEQQALTSYLKKLEATDSKKVTMLREKMQKSNKNAVKSISKVVTKARDGPERAPSQNSVDKPADIPNKTPPVQHTQSLLPGQSINQIQTFSNDQSSSATLGQLTNNTTMNCENPSETSETRAASLGDGHPTMCSINNKGNNPRGPDVRPHYEEDRFKAYPGPQDPHTGDFDQRGFSQQQRPPEPYQRDYGNRLHEGTWWNHGPQNFNNPQGAQNYDSPSNPQLYRSPSNPEPYRSPAGPHNFSGPRSNQGGPYRDQNNFQQGNMYRGGPRQPQFQDRW